MRVRDFEESPTNNWTGPPPTRPMTPCEAIEDLLNDDGGDYGLDDHYWCRDCSVHVCHYENPAPGDCTVTEPHALTCPYGSLPAILKAIETAERLSSLIVSQQWGHDEDIRPTVDGKDTYSWCPSCDASWPCKWFTVIAVNTTLVTALRGEDITR